MSKSKEKPGESAKKLKPHTRQEKRALSSVRSLKTLERIRVEQQCSDK